MKTIVDNDPFAVRLPDGLKAKSVTVPVRVYFDALGSEMAGKKFRQRLEKIPPGAP